MATSSFQQSALANQQKLLDQLVPALLGTTINVSEKRRAVAVCQQRLKFHSFLDTDPSNVEGMLQDIMELLHVESRQRGAEHLLRLKQCLFNIPMGSDVTDVHYSILRFLLCLAGDLTLKTLQDEENEMEIDPESLDKGADEITEGSAWSSEKYDSDSELSHWTDDDNVEETVAEKESGLQSVLRVECPDWQAYFVPTRASDGVHSVKQMQSDGSLLQCLAQIQLPEFPLEACSLFLRSESELVLNCLRALQGRESSVFLWDRHDRTLCVDAQIQTLHFSASAMRDALTLFGRCGCYARRVLDWTSAIIDTSGRQDLAGLYGRPIPRQRVVSPTLSATAQAIHEQLNAVLRPAIQLEQHLDSNGREGMSLVQLKCLCMPVMRQIHALYRIYHHVQRVESDEKTSSETSREVLDGLYDLSCSDFLMGSPCYRTSSELVWNVFVESLGPLLSQLTSWLFLGDLSSLSEDFFISPKPARNSEDSDFWLDSFPLKDSGCPKFLSSVVSVVQDGGKALQLMRSQEYGQQFEDFGINRSVKTGRLEALIHDRWTTDLLATKFKSFLSSVEKPHHHPPPERKTETKTIAQKMAVAGEYSSGEVMSMIQEPVIPWTYISEEDVIETMPSAPSTSDGSYSPQSTETTEVVGSTEEMEIEDSTNLPTPYIRVHEAMERVRIEFEASLTTDVRSSKSALKRILPNPTDRASYAQLRDTIFRSIHPVLELSNTQSHKQTSHVPSPIHSIPVEVLLKKGLLEIIHERSLEIVRSFIDCLSTDLGLMTEFMILKNVFLIGSPAMYEWARRFSEKLINGNGLPDLRELQIILDMQECFQSCDIGEALPVCGDNEFEELFFDMRTSEWHPTFPDQQLWKERSPQELDDCALLYPLKWPLCLVVNEPRLKRYNTVFLFLLKLQWVSCAVKNNGWLLKKLQGGVDEELLSSFRHLSNWRQLYKLSHEMTHFIGHLQQHVLENIHSSFDQFCQGVSKVESVSELLNQHDTTLDAITRFSFQARKKQWKTVHARLLTLFHAILNFCSIWNTIAAADPHDRVKLDLLLECMDRVVEQYNEARSSVMMILQIYSCSLGGNRELNHLIDLLNFNELYQHYNP